MLNLSLSGRMSGSGKLMIKRADGSIETPQQGNKLLDRFFARVHAGATFTLDPKLKVGTGSTPNDANTTQLTAVLPPKFGSWPTGVIIDEPIATLINGGTTIRAYIKYQFACAVGQIEGNIAEYGVNVYGDSTTTSGIVDTRILLTDVDDNPTTITLGALDQLIGEYTFVLLLPYADVVSTVTANHNGTPTDYEITVRHGPLGKFSNYMNLSWANQGATQSILTTEKNIGSAGNPLPQAADASQGGAGGPAVVGSATKRTYAVDIPIDKGNLVGGIAGLAIGSLSNWYKIGFNPPLPKALNNNIKFTLNLMHA